MLLKPQRYNLKVSYKRRKEMYIADLLSRTFNDSQNLTNSKVENFHIFYWDLENINVTDYLNFSDKNILRLKKETVFKRRPFVKFIERYCSFRMVEQSFRHAERRTNILDISRQNWHSKWYHLQRMEGAYSEINAK